MGKEIENDKISAILYLGDEIIHFAKESQVKESKEILNNQWEKKSK